VERTSCRLSKRWFLRSSEPAGPRALPSAQSHPKPTEIPRPRIAGPQAPEHTCGRRPPAHGKGAGPATGHDHVGQVRPERLRRSGPWRFPGTTLAGAAAVGATEIRPARSAQRRLNSVGRRSHNLLSSPSPTRSEAVQLGQSQLPAELTRKWSRTRPTPSGRRQLSTSLGRMG